MTYRYFEDFTQGQTVDLGSVTFTEPQIIEFARAFDPQPIHVDPEAARGSIYAGLIASGWQTVTAYMRMLVDQIVADSASLGSPGLDHVRWPRPVRPGDTLRARFSVLETRPSKSRPEWGIVRSKGEMFNQRDELVMSVEAVNFFGRRPQSR
ncbi:MAG TPA: MaoC family dehydratase [Chloroflexota bacterium]